ncbi:MAG TPA: uracil phosphoribosyltransferase [Ktedonobacterales bacterium]|jgi:uracil phosphoribosyltransferase|nr:uracil phosphoribosyltransferase [Ktedonobacterales bacterium]HZC79279.1 uracil phosphoribosyltransferase [Ktedonobacterales bacterium]
MQNERAAQRALPMRGVEQPARADVLELADVHISRHPVVEHKMTSLRDRSTPPPEFYRLVRELGTLLAYEATADLHTRPARIETPLEPMEGKRLAGGVGIMPVLRAGIGLAEGFRAVLPDAPVWHLGLRRDESTLEPIEYYNQLARAVNLQVCFAVDPMLATGGSAIDALNILKRYGVPHLRYVGLIAAPYGLKKLRETHPDVPIYLAALDERLDERGYICPGLGDAGDRQFGTM